MADCDLLCGVPVVGTSGVGYNDRAIAEGVFFDESAGNDAAAYAGVVERQVAYSRANFSLSVGAGGHTPVFSMAMRA